MSGTPISDVAPSPNALVAKVEAKRRRPPKKPGLVRRLLGMREEEIVAMVKEALAAPSRALWSRLTILERRLDEMTARELDTRLTMARYERQIASLISSARKRQAECFSTTDSDE